MIGSHIIPRFYLEQFSTPATLPRKPGRVWVYHKGKKPSNRATTVQGFENGYFGFVRPDGSLDEAPEERLAELERRSNDVLASAKSPLFDWTSRMSRHTLAFYAGLLHARATQRRDFSARNWNRIQKEFAELVSDETYVQELTVLYKKRFPDQDVTAAAIRNRLQALAQQNQTSASSKNIFLDTLMHNTEIIKTALLEKAWQVWRAPNGVEFVTSDNPLVTFLPIDEQRFAPGHGFRVAGVVAAFPLAPGACLLMGISGPESVTVSESRVQSVNEVLISLCDRFVYSKTLSDRVQKLVDEIGGSYRYGENAFLPIGMRPTDVRAFMRKRMGLD